MRELLKVGLIALLAAFVGGVLAVSVVGGNSQPSANVGGYTEGDWDSAGGYKVDGTTVIDGSGNVDAPITSTTGTFSSTLAVSGATSLETLTQGGGATTTTYGGSTYTLVQADIDVENTIEILPNKELTLTLPASSTLTTVVPNAGDVRQLYLYNASTTAAATITVAAGTGIDLQMAEATGGDLVLEGLDWAKLTFIRQNDTDVTVIFDEMKEAD